MKIKVDLENARLDVKDETLAKALEIKEYLKKDSEEYTGWVNWPSAMPAEWMAGMHEAAGRIRDMCDVLIVIGIGGSYLGTAAVLEALGISRPGCPEILYAGNNMSGYYLADFKKVIEEREAALCVVSKSGGTMETRLAFSVLKDWMLKKYGREGTAKRIVAVTDPVKGTLREETDREGYINFEIPGNIGGRYSAFTPAIMFPLAVAGVDIDAFLKGARDIASDESFWNEGLKYAAARYALYESGKEIEIFEYYDPSLRLIGEWCKQLFGESEGKDGKGIFPASLTFSTDLHSMGQFLQQGNQLFFETILDVKNRSKDVTIPDSAGPDLAGRSLNDINAMAVKGVMTAHAKASIPMIKIDIDDINEESLGQLLYFFMMSAAVTGKLMGIDPFNQPGVEDYKQEIRALLGQ